MKYHASSFGSCKKCKKNADLEDHHIHPKRYYQGGKDKCLVIFLCSDCHDEIEELLAEHLKMSRKWYDNFTKKWLEGKINYESEVLRRKMNKKKRILRKSSKSSLDRKKRSPTPILISKSLRVAYGRF